MANIKKNDNVKVISGANKGKTGTVISVKDVCKRHEKPSQTNQTGGIVEKELPIDISNVMLLEGNTPVRTRIVREKGKKGVRTSVKTGKAV